jgi:hypothetical protein
MVERKVSTAEHPYGWFIPLLTIDPSINVLLYACGQILPLIRSMSPVIEDFQTLKLRVRETGEKKLALAS